MKRLFSLILVFVFYPCLLPAQTDSTCPDLQSAAQSWAAKDTAATIAHLRKVCQSNSGEAGALQACLRLGQLYVAKGELDSAKTVLEKGLEFRAKWVCVFEGFDRFSSSIRYNAVKAHICLLLAEIARLRSDHHGRLYHLLMADTKHVAYATCGTGMHTFRTSITPEIAEAYLAVGDTAKAIKRLFEYLLYSSEAVEKLKPFLQQKYTHEQIKRKFKSAVAAIKKVVEKEGNETRSYTVFTAFGHTLFKDDYGDPQSLRRYIAKNPRLDWFRD